MPKDDAVPPGQLLHSVEPVTSMYFPAEQAKQAELPEEDVDLPASQSVHPSGVPWAPANCPLGHNVYWLAPLPVNVPGGASAQEDWPDPA
jgi:hypothetical protein